jgi:hypothetical protein
MYPTKLRISAGFTLAIAMAGLVNSSFLGYSVGPITDRKLSIILFIPLLICVSLARRELNGSSMRTDEENGSGRPPHD